MGRNEVEISILQYADDIVFFGDATMQNVVAIKTMLRSFEMVSGLKINFAKSYFGAFGVSDEWVYHASTVLNGRLLLMPFSYLELLIRANPRLSETWDPIVD